MKQGICLKSMDALDLLESMGSIIIDFFGKEYYRLPVIMERIGEDTWVVHVEADKDVPEYLAAVRREFNDLDGKPGKFKLIDLQMNKKSDKP